MVGVEILTGHGQAVTTLGIVFVEAILLYAGYGLVAGVTVPVLEQAIVGE